MARPAYPSDEARRKTRPHVRVHLSITNHPRYASTLSDPETRGVIIGLWVVAARAHASKTNDEITLHRGDVGWITGRDGLRAGLARLRRACDAMSYPMRTEGGVAIVKIRNFARKQGFDSAERGADSGGANGATSPPKSDPKTDVREEEGAPRDGGDQPEPRKPSRPRAPKIDYPPAPPSDESLPLRDLGAWIRHTLPDRALAPDRVEALRAMRPGGRLHGPGAVQCWWVATAPKISDKGYADVWRAARNWWKRVTPEEIHAAVKVVEQLAGEAYDAQHPPDQNVPPQYTPEQIAEAGKGLRFI